jgi:hypothetical protein
MTEQEWLTCTDPHPMLEFLRGQASDRKLRLFAVACSRCIWDQIDAFGRHAVDVAERFADRFATPEELRAARLSCQGAGGQAAWYAAASNPAIAARNAARSAQAGAGCEADELLGQAALVREIFGNPFRPVCLAPSCMTSGAVKLAKAIYEERAFARMPELADVLEKAGCADHETLRHCRRPGLHVRGCWALELVLENGPKT